MVSLAFLAALIASPLLQQDIPRIAAFEGRYTVLRGEAMRLVAEGRSDVPLKDSSGLRMRIRFGERVTVLSIRLYRCSDEIFTYNFKRQMEDSKIDRPTSATNRKCIYLTSALSSLAQALRYLLEYQHDSDDLLLEVANKQLEIWQAFDRKLILQKLEK